jgi:TatD DNase family protein
LETDSPVLGANRQERNEPANVILALQAVSDLRGLSSQAVAEAVEENTRRL